MTKPQVNKYSSYREFINARFQYLCAKEKYSHRKFSRAAGLGSPNYLIMVVSGNRNLGPEAAPKVAKGLMLTAEETTEFLDKVYSEANKNFQTTWNRVS